MIYPDEMEEYRKVQTERKPKSKNKWCGYCGSFIHHEFITHINRCEKEI